MQSEKDFKNLLKGAAMQTNVGFADKVMSQVYAINNAKAGTVALVSKRWKRIYQILFAVVFLACVTMSFIIQPSRLPFSSYIQQSWFSKSFVQQAIFCLVGFWVLILLGSVFNNDKQERRLHF